ncbi:PGF-pre-PGF domain-containing protein, partial [candidate division KSB1 bacterium]
MNGTDNITLIIRGNNSYFNNSQYDEINTSLFDETGLIFGFNFEDDTQSDRNVTDVRGTQDAVVSTGVDWVDGGYIMQEALRFNASGDNRVNVSQNFDALKAGNYSFLIGGLIVYKNITPQYNSAGPIFSQLNAGTFAGTAALVTYDENNWNLFFGNILAGGAGSGASVNDLNYGEEICIGGTMRQINSSTWNITSYTLSRQGEKVDNSYIETSPSDNNNLYIGQTDAVVSAKANMTMGSIGIYDASNYLSVDDLRDYCYGRLDRYYGYGEHDNGRLKIAVDDNLTIAEYVFDSNNQTATSRYAIHQDSSDRIGNIYNYRFMNNTFYGFHSQIALIGSSSKVLFNSYFSGNHFSNRGASAVALWMSNTMNCTFENLLFNDTEGVALALIYSHNATVRNNNFTNINRSWYTDSEPYGALTVGIGNSNNVMNCSIYNNWFDNIANGTALYTNSQGCNITRNTFHNASFFYSKGTQYAVHTDDISGAVSYLNNFYGTGVNESIVGPNCKDGEGNFFEENIPSTQGPILDCGPANFTNPLNNTEVENSGDTVTMTWDKQSSLNSITYYLYYTLNNSGWVYMGSTTSTSYAWDYSAVAPSNNVTIKIVPNDGTYNATHAFTLVNLSEYVAPPAAEEPAATTRTSGGSGGSGGAVSDGIYLGPSVGYIFDKIMAGETEVMTFNKEGLPFTRVEFVVNNDLTNIDVDIRALYEEFVDVAKPSTPVYQFVKFDKHRFTDSDVKEVIISFKVLKSWLEENGIAKEDVVLLVHDGQTWKDALSTELEQSSSITGAVVGTTGGSWLRKAWEWIKFPFKWLGGSITGYVVYSPAAYEYYVATTNIMGLCAISGE